MPGPYAVKVRTPDGWQDLAVVGPPGPTGAVGAVGPPGPPGYQVYAWHGDGENPNYANIPGTSTPTLIPLYVVSGGTNRVSKSDGTNPDFILNPNKTIQVVQAGFYEITAIVEMFGVHTTAQVFVSQLSTADSPTGTDTTMWGVIDQADYGPTQTTPSWSRPTHNHAVGIYLAAGSHVGLQGFVNTQDASVRCRYFSIAMIGTGPRGPQGVSGTAVVSEQPAAPASPVIGQLWIDTDDPVPQGPVLGPPLASSLPGSPYDGQEIRFVADATNGIIWHLRYRSASSSAYKWEFVGGSSLLTMIDTDETITSDGTWRDATTLGPDVTIPLAGDYIYELSVSLRSTAAAATMNAGVSLGAGNQPAAANTIWVSGLTAGWGMSTHMLSKISALSAAQLLRTRYTCNTGTCSIRLRKLLVTPVRVG